MDRCGGCHRVKFMGCFFGVMLLVIVLTGTASFAASAWFDCSVDLVGPGKTETFIALTDLAEEPVFVGKWFLLPVEQAREMLAVALTAINSNKKVVVVVDPDSGSYPAISELYLRAQ